MTQYALFLIIVTLLVKPLGSYLARVFSHQPTALDRILLPLERFIYRLIHVDSAREMSAREYSFSFLAAGFVNALVLYGVLRFQQFLPWFFPEYHAVVSPDLAFNTALSFTTTTTWQAYPGERTMSYFSQLVGLGVGNFLAGAAGLAVGVAFIRGLSRQQSDTIGNFWVDYTRSLLWVLVPGALIGAVILIGQGVPMNFSPYTSAATLEGAVQVVAQGPVAAFEIIKNLGTNGGGFFNVNGAHPFENPTPLSNLLEMLAIVLVPAALTNTFGRMTSQPKQGWMLYAVMLTLFLAGAAVLHVAEVGNMEGKEVRFGVPGSTLTGIVTSNTATGSYNAMDDSLTPIGGMVLLVNMLLGEVIFGGLGTGLVSLIMVALLAVFLAGLMIGRTPEYLSKRVGTRETKMILLYAIVAPIALLVLTAIAVSTKLGLSGLTTNYGPHGLTTILFAYTSAFANNGHIFASMNANNPFYNVTTAVSIVAGRYILVGPALCLAGLFAAQRRAPVTTGSLKTDSPTFAIFLIGVLLVMTGLSYMPVLTLGPILEHLAFFVG